ELDTQHPRGELERWTATLRESNGIARELERALSLHHARQRHPRLAPQPRIAERIRIGNKRRIIACLRQPPGHLELAYTPPHVLRLLARPPLQEHPVARLDAREAPLCLFETPPLGQSVHDGELHIEARLGIGGERGELFAERGRLREAACRARPLH